MGSNPSTRLSVEIEFYESHKAEWMKDHEGNFVVVKGTLVLGFFKDFHDACYVGFKEFGTNTDLLIKRIVLREPVFMVF